MECSHAKTGQVSPEKCTNYASWVRAFSERALHFPNVGISVHNFLKKSRSLRELGFFFGQVSPLLKSAFHCLKRGKNLTSKMLVLFCLVLFLVELKFCFWLIVTL